MWRTQTTLVALIGALLLSSANRASEVQPDSSLPNQLGWVQFEIVLGKISPGVCTSTKCRTRSFTNEKTGVKETFRVSPIQSRTAFEYDRTDGSKKLAISYHPDSGLEIDSSHGDIQVHLVQNLQGRVSVSVEPGGFEAEATGIWRLAMKHPEMFRQYIEPPLQYLRGDWRLTAFVARTQQQLPTVAAQGSAVSEDVVLRLVQQLRADAFSERNKAHKALIAIGSAALPILNSIEDYDLCSEQAKRLQAIRQQLKPRCNDTPGRVARMLRGDRTVWLAMLNHDDRHIRATAADHLTMLCGTTIQFDADADAIARQIQIGRLRDQLATRR